MRVRIVICQRKVLKLEFKNVLHVWIQGHFGQRTRIARKLKFELLNVVVVDVSIAKGVDEFTRLESDDLRDHQREKCIRCDVERNAQKDVGAALVELTGEFSICHIKLKECMARRQRCFSICDISRE